MLTSYSVEYGLNSNCASLKAKAECFFLNGISTELAMPTMVVLVDCYKTLFAN